MLRLAGLACLLATAGAFQLQAPTGTGNSSRSQLCQVRRLALEFAARLTAEVPAEHANPLLVNGPSTTNNR